ncbi:MAG: hypothetical protein IJX65_02895 [Alistipes sp.]|nr:hypothetical protein [Eggerthellaceae bacterium]MBQ9137566.1 hypothetical protein [Alistipes sp.]
MAATPTAGGVMSIVDEMAENYEPSEIVKATPGLPDTSDPKQIYGAVALASQDTGLDAIAYNEMAGRPYVRGVLPWSRKNEHRPFTDVDFSHFTAYMQYKYEITKNKMEDVMKIFSYTRKYNPVLDALDALPDWDNTSDRERLFIDYLGAADTPYTRAVTALFFNGAVSRAYEPGCKFDYCLVLVGSQGIGKSSLVRALALRDEFFLDNLGNLGNKEAAENLQGRWVVEIAELASFNKKDAATIKLFISQQYDTYRAPYSRSSEQHPRRCVFVGTTNETGFLKDLTGARRFLPIQCSAQQATKDVLDREALTADIEQAYAQTLCEYRKEGWLPLVLPHDVAADALRVQEEYAAEDAREGLIREWLEPKQTEGSRICILQIQEEVFNLDRSQANNTQGKAMQGELRQMLDNKFPGWMRAPKGKRATIPGYGQQNYWEYHTS